MHASWGRSVVLLAALVLFTAGPTAAQTQGGIAGVVRDTTGAVLPGVTVEAASPALIEKLRTAVTDGQGRYNITDLRPGTYSVTFMLPGFSTFRREGIELSAGFTATANADMKVGGLEETVTVTGASPVVDIQNVRTQQVLKAGTLEALPSGQRDITQLASLTLGATAANDVGGDKGEISTGISIHGASQAESKVNYDGMNTNVFYATAGGGNRIWKFNTIGVQETVVDTGGADAETQTAGANVNMVPRDGGNNFSLHSVVNYTNTDFASGKVADDLIARGSAADQNSMKKVYDYGVGIGGPIVRDRLWFYSANRLWGSQSYGANNYFNKSADWWRYEPDVSRPAYTDYWQRDAGGRFTWQAAAKHKFNTSLNWQRACGCWLGISGGSTSSPEATTSYDYGAPNGMWLSQTSWSYPATNRLLVQGTAAFLKQTVRFTNEDVPGPNDVSILEQTTGRRWGALLGGTQGGSYELPHPGDNYTQRASAAYVTGTHSAKVGVQTLQGVYDIAGDARPNAVAYVFRNGRPLSLTQFATPFFNDVRVRSVGVFAQDQWTVQRLTLNLGLRYDHHWAYVKPMTLPAGRFVGERSFPGVKDLPNYQDITPRLGVAYDLFGNGRTALKGSWGRYLVGLGGGDAYNNSPAIAVIASTDRLWDDANGNFIPDCDLRNLQANNECQTVNNLAFGQPRTVTRWDSKASQGWGVREFTYQYSVAVQHELKRGLGITVSYNRNDFKNQQAVVNQALTVADYSPYCITAPTDPRLGATSGAQICGLFDENPNKFGQVDAVRVRIEDIPGANGRPKNIFNGVDIAMNARFGQGGLLMGGIALGRTTSDFCWQNDLPNVLQQGAPANRPRTEGYCDIQAPFWDGTGSQIKLQAVYPLPFAFIVSGTYKQLPGIDLQANYSASNLETRSTLGRDLAACRGTTGAACTARVTVPLLPTAALYDERINQVDLRLTRTFRLRSGRIQGIAELYNALNGRPAQGIATTYGGTWMLPTALLGGRLFKLGAQVDF